MRPWAAATTVKHEFSPPAAWPCGLVSRQVQHAATYEHRMQEGSKAIFHLEAFVAKFMSTYKNWTLSMMAE